MKIVIENNELLEIINFNTGKFIIIKGKDIT
jgi:hypothetical protein